MALPFDQVQAFVADALKRSPDVVILIDEAYIEYAEGAVRSALPLALASPRVLVSRTFSKMYDMAGLRVGYAMGQAALLERRPTSVGQLVAMTALVASIVAVKATAPH